MSIPVTVARPQGAGPFPAVVMMHDCSGLGPRSSGAPARLCTAARPATEVGPARRVQDAYEALDYARRLPYVDGQRVGIMGGSHGGATTLSAMSQPGFRAGVALYPRCSVARRGYAPPAPLLILAGELDDWTPARECTRLAGGNVTLKVYPGAHHSFDSDRPVRFVAERLNPNAPGGRGATTGGNPAAWKDAIEQVTAFFDRHLGEKR